jgi:hypothetical protein
VPPGETRPLKAIETAEAWVRGDATPEQVRASASWAAEAAWAAAWASAAAEAAWAAAWAAAAAEAARDETLKTCADIVRQFYPQAPTTC